MNNSAPAVFISHASEDKDRFVNGLAARLRATGVNAWLDKWEMQPGDSLVDKIFEEGIGRADVVLVVLSHVSLNKEWVREELNAAVVRKIEGRCRLMAVLIDDVEVPVPLKSTVWQRVSDTSSYDTEFDAIVRAIFGVSNRPPLGPAPAYASGRPLPGLSQLDSQVLSLACDMALALNDRHVNGPALRSACETANLTSDAAFEAMLALKEAGLIEEVTFEGDDFPLFVFVSSSGLMSYLRDARADLPEVENRVLAHLVNHDGDRVDLGDLARAIGETTLVVETVLDPYERRRLLTITRLLGGSSMVEGISPLLRRHL